MLLDRFLRHCILMLPYITTQFTIVVTCSFPDLTAMGKGRVCSSDDEPLESTELTADTRDYRFCEWKKLIIHAVQRAVISCRTIRFEDFFLPSLALRGPYL
jgi:hypothetical protein